MEENVKFRDERHVSYLQVRAPVISMSAYAIAARGSSKNNIF